MEQKSFNNWIVFVMLLCVFFSTINTIVFLPAWKEVYQESFYRMKVSDNKQNVLPQNLAMVCNYNLDNISKIECVHRFLMFSGLYEYNISVDFIEADDLEERGADCKSWTTFYMSTIELMGIDTKIIQTDMHVFVLAYGLGYYCIIDQTEIDCKEQDISVLEDYEELIEAEKNKK